MPSDRLAKSQREDISPLGLLDPPDIRIECPAFSGSLSMLFMCVRERKIDLRDVPLGPVCEAYLRYVVDRENPDLEAAAVALSALSYLLERKAWVLIPVPEVPEPEAEDLWDEIEPSAHEFLPAIEDLLQRRADRENLFFRTPDAVPYELPFDTKAVTPLDLARAFERLLAKAKPDTFTPPSRPRRSLSDMMVVVMKYLPVEWKPLDEIVPGTFTRSEAVWWFLALLELIRLAQARVALVDGQAQFCREVTS